MVAMHIQSYHAYILLILPSSLSNQDLAIAAGANTHPYQQYISAAQLVFCTYLIHTHHWMKYSQQMVSFGILEE
jgi:hypothetical protein